MNFMRDVALSGGMNPYGSNRATALNIEVAGNEIDTCYAGDTGMWETGIQRGDASFVTVETYDNPEDAPAGHAKWVQAITANPNLELVEVGFDDWLGL